MHARSDNLEINTTFVYEGIASLKISWKKQTALNEITHCLVSMAITSRITSMRTGNRFWI